MKHTFKYIGIIMLAGMFFASCDPEPVNDKELIEKQLKLTLDQVLNHSIAYDTVSDIEGNEYKTIVVGNYEWFAQNLQTTKLNDGTPIKNIVEAKEWTNASEPAYASYQNTKKTSVHGLLYNYKVVETGKVCPEGWEVPNDSIWFDLTKEFTGKDTAGVFMKSPKVWYDDQLANNKSGFSAVPSGMKEKNGKYYVMGENAFWWSDTRHNNENARYFYIDKNTSLNSSHMFREFGLSIRCVRKK